MLLVSLSIVTKLSLKLYKIVINRDLLEFAGICSSFLIGMLYDDHRENNFWIFSAFPYNTNLILHFCDWVVHVCVCTLMVCIRVLCLHVSMIDQLADVERCARRPQPAAVRCTSSCVLSYACCYSSRTTCTLSSLPREQATGPCHPDNIARHQFISQTRCYWCVGCPRLCQWICHCCSSYDRPRYLDTRPSKPLLCCSSLPQIQDCTRQNQGWRHHIAIYKEAWDFVHVRAQETTPASGRDLTDYILTDWLADWIQHAASAFKLCREFTNADSYVFSEAGRLPTCFTIKNVIYSDGNCHFLGQ